MVGQLWHRIVERGGGGTVLGILCGVSIAAYILEWIVDAILYQYRPGWIFRLLAGFVYLHYMLKIRQAAAREGGFQDHPVLCGIDGGQTIALVPALHRRFLMRHDIYRHYPAKIRWRAHGGDGVRPAGLVPLPSAFPPPPCVLCRLRSSAASPANSAS